MQGRFHGDITPGHIILYKEPGQHSRKGYLVDWDLSRTVDDGGEYIQEFQVSVRDGTPYLFDFLLTYSSGYMAVLVLGCLLAQLCR